VKKKKWEKVHGGGKKGGVKKRERRWEMGERKKESTLGQ
jgi:hypothetical protein